jgi:large subunit ribosomal protein L29
LKASELRDLVATELEDRVKTLRTALFNLQLKFRTGQLANSASVRTARRNLARALTVQAERRRAS